MTKKEILALCKWDEYDFAHMNLFIPMFGQEVDIRFIPSEETGLSITDNMVISLNDVLRLTSKDLDTIKEYLWADCTEAFNDIDYGHEPIDGETDTEANHREFNIHSSEDAYKNSNLKCITIEENAELKNIYSAIDFEPPWEQEHGVSVVVKNGKLIARYSNDVAYGMYESDGYG